MVYVMTFGFVFLAILMMAVGVIFTGKTMRGSCGGRAVYDAKGKEIFSCELCEDPCLKGRIKKGVRKLKEKTISEDKDSPL